MKQGETMSLDLPGINPDYQAPLLVVVENGVVLQQNVESLPW